MIVIRWIVSQFILQRRFRRLSSARLESYVFHCMNCRFLAYHFLLRIPVVA